MTEPLLRVEGLRASHGARQILHDVSLELVRGEILAIIGPNGSGKTTLLKTIAGRHENFTGKIILDGHDPVNMGPNWRARRMCAVSQVPEMPSGITVMQLALLGRLPWLGWSGLYGKKDYECARAALTDADLQAMEHRLVGTLSGGEWKRALLARALSQACGGKAPVLVLDEICSGLDPSRAIEILSLLAKKRDSGFGIVIAMHEYNLAAIFADFIVGLKNGAVLFSGKTVDVFNQRNLSALYEFPMDILIHPDLGLPQAFPRFGHYGNHPGLRLSTCSGRRQD